MAALSFKEALNKAMKIIKKYVDIKTTEEPESDTFEYMLEQGLVIDALELEDGLYLTDENDDVFQI